ncbi:hypothetical protein BJ875DRAFT_212733 [Amylocarpus encephaloides]|uniref:Uncharacterized protein n=1 Tax=Amylocarpus encephaloides TaxID=45428 RepID=A0A9P7YN73_9HELO|nr:hypothetical protein BJ875DRAFT_212733 [Amylocarpus encephaloides]
MALRATVPYRPVLAMTDADLDGTRHPISWPPAQHRTNPPSGLQNRQFGIRGADLEARKKGVKAHSICIEAEFPRSRFWIFFGGDFLSRGFLDVHLEILCLRKTIERRLRRGLPHIRLYIFCFYFWTRQRQRQRQRPRQRGIASLSIVEIRRRLLRRVNSLAAQFEQGILSRLVYLLRDSHQSRHLNYRQPIPSFHDFASRTPQPRFPYAKHHHLQPRDSSSKPQRRADLPTPRTCLPDPPPEPPPSEAPPHTPLSHPPLPNANAAPPSSPSSSAPSATPSSSASCFR